MAPDLTHKLFHLAGSKQVSQSTMLGPHDCRVFLIADFLTEYDEHMASQAFPKRQHDIVV
jgi:hypothetical protein